MKTGEGMRTARWLKEVSPSAVPGFDSRPCFADRSWATSFRDALRGVFHVIRTQRNARVHLLATVAVVALGLWLGLAPGEWAVLALAISLVLATEMLNTALEILSDVSYQELHPLVGLAKDVAAGAVLMSALGAAVVGLLILVPRLLERLQ